MHKLSGVLLLSNLEWARGELAAGCVEKMHRGVFSWLKDSQKIIGKADHGHGQCTASNPCALGRRKELAMVIIHLKTIQYNNIQASDFVLSDHHIKSQKSHMIYL